MLLPQYEALSAAKIAHFCQRWLSPAQQQQLQQQGQVDCALQLPEGQRLRANFFRQQQGTSLALRLINAQCPVLAELGVPPIVVQLAQQQSGLLLVTGATGSGKSTTLAAMLDYLNQHCYRHIITLEDPVEFIHQSAGCLIQQRELGTDSHSGELALHAALRQDPDVILLGELRDTASIRLALSAAETGHLVMATLHTRGAAEAIARLVDVFSAEEKPYVRTQLADSLQGVIAQKLLPLQGGGRAAIFEILTSSTAVRSLIREGKNHQLATVLQTGSQSGMQTFQQSYTQQQANGFRFAINTEEEI